jgi:hypothetical protein
MSFRIKRNVQSHLPMTVVSNVTDEKSDSVENVDQVENEDGLKSKQVLKPDSKNTQDDVSKYKKNTSGCFIIKNDNKNVDYY